MRSPFQQYRPVSNRLAQPCCFLTYIIADGIYNDLLKTIEQLSKSDAFFAIFGRKTGITRHEYHNISEVPLETWIGTIKYKLSVWWLTSYISHEIGHIILGHIKFLSQIPADFVRIKLEGEESFMPVNLVRQAFEIEADDVAAQLTVGVAIELNASGNAWMEFCIASFALISSFAPYLDTDSPEDWNKKHPPFSLRVVKCIISISDQLERLRNVNAKFTPVARKFNLRRSEIITEYLAAPTQVLSSNYSSYLESSYDSIGEIRVTELKEILRRINPALGGFPRTSK